MVGGRVLLDGPAEPMNELDSGHVNERYRWIMAPLLGAALAGTALRRRALSPSGAAAAACVGTAVFGAGGWRDSALLLLFFGSSTALSRLPSRHEAVASSLQGVVRGRNDTGAGPNDAGTGPQGAAPAAISRPR